MSYNLRSASVVTQEEYTEESDIEDDSDIDIDLEEITRKSSHVINSNKKKNFLNTMANQSPFSDQGTVPGALNEAAATAVNTMFTGVQHSKPECKILNKLVIKFLKKEPIKEDGIRLREKALLICNTILEIYPNRSFYNLISRWSRKKKLDYTKDILNTTFVLLSHFEEETLWSFLENCRTFQLRPKSDKRKKLSIQFNKLHKKCFLHDDIVDKLDISMQLLYGGLTNIENVCLHRVRMASVSNNQSFDLATSKNDTSSTLRFETKAFAGMHTPNSFKNRVWNNVLSLKLAYLLFGFIFGPTLVQQMMYPNLKKKGGENFAISFEIIE